MAKDDDNKLSKRNALLKTAFDLFAEKGFAKTTISDIVEKAGLAKGTFYLYFKDKYDLRDKLIAYKGNRLFEETFQEMRKLNLGSFEEEICFITDYIIDRFQKQHDLLQFVAKNLSWGVFKTAFSNADFPATYEFYQHYLDALDRYRIHCQSPELMLFTMIELIGTTSYNCILLEQPVSMDEYLPYLHKTLKHIFLVFTEEK